MSKKPLFKIDPGSEVKASGNGYIYVTTTPDHKNGEVRPEHDKRYVYLHRALVELREGRYLKDDEEVHHKDGNNANNALSNLELSTSTEHSRQHALTDNPFWKKSPLNKPKKKHKKAMARDIIAKFLEY